ncbi:serine hydrolase domain-containing protein [Paenibacillus sp. 481]|uniref:serine hydrolase domain-containing protein n=1 Tax=Paenibacillus sp. 481 TaxID=2835869 RepID=UPI001E4FCDA5|nr:serine hydrolase [Paenibacillus sp. 481]UHA75492.1 serine hydrolase [Paenibacillus sp. 481]
MKKILLSVAISLTLLGSGGSLALAQSATTATVPYEIPLYCSQYISPDYDFSKVALMYSKEKRSELFRNMNTTSPHELVDVGPKKVPFLKQAQDISQLTYTYRGKTTPLSDLLTRTETSGFIVIKDGKIVNEQYFNGSFDCSRHLSMSVSKSVTSALIGIAIDEGKIKSVDDLVTDYLPQLKQTGYDGVTIKQVLQMSTGIKFNERYTDPNSDINKLNTHLMTEKKSYEDYILTLQRESTPGIFNYKSINTQVLGMLIQKVTGQTPAKYLEDKIWKPAGMEASAYFMTDLHNTSMVMGGFNATLRDYAKFGLIYMNNGQWNGKQLISEKWIKESVTPPVDRPDMQPGVQGKPFGYQYQWWIPKDNNGSEFFALGIWGQYIYINQQEKVVIVKASTDPNFSRNAYEIITAFRAVTETLKQ